MNRREFFSTAAGVATLASTQFGWAAQAVDPKVDWKKVRQSTLDRIAIMTLNFQSILKVPDTQPGPNRTLELFDIGEMLADTYGPRMRLRDGRAVPAFMSQALRGEDVTIFGTGQQTRSFCYVSDLVDGVIRLMESDVNDPVNIGNPHEMTIEEIARAIIRLTGSKSQLVYRPLPEDDPKVRQPDITRARTLLHWEPKVGLEEGLKKTLEYFKGQVEAEGGKQSTQQGKGR